MQQGREIPAIVKKLALAFRHSPSLQVRDTPFLDRFVSAKLAPEPRGRYERVRRGPGTKSCSCGVFSPPFLYNRMPCHLDGCCDTRRHMSDSHGALRGIDVLPARAAGSENLEPELAATKRNEGNRTKKNPDDR